MVPSSSGGSPGPATATSSTSATSTSPARGRPAPGTVPRAARAVARWAPALPRGLAVGVPTRRRRERRGGTRVAGRARGSRAPRRPGADDTEEARLAAVFDPVRAGPGEESGAGARRQGLDGGPRGWPLDGCGAMRCRGGRSPGRRSTRCPPRGLGDGSENVRAPVLTRWASRLSGRTRYPTTRARSRLRRGRCALPPRGSRGPARRAPVVG